MASWLLRKGALGVEGQAVTEGEEADDFGLEKLQARRRVRFVHSGCTVSKAESQHRLQEWEEWQM